MKNIKNKSLLKKFLFIGIIIYVVYTFFSQQKMLNAYKEDQERYSEQIAEAEELQEELKTTKENINSSFFIFEVFFIPFSFAIWRNSTNVQFSNSIFFAPILNVIDL